MRISKFKFDSDVFTGVTENMKIVRISNFKFESDVFTGVTKIPTTK